jgi:hypothetical protein
LGQIAETTERVKARNRIAAELIRDRSNVTDDLYGLVEPHQDYFSGDGVHFNEKGRELQAKQVAEAVVAYIPEFAHPVVLVTPDPLKTEPARREITIRDLLTHRSGLGYPATAHLGATDDVHEQLRGSFSWGGYWSTSFRISPRGD